MNQTATSFVAYAKIKLYKHNYHESVPAPSRIKIYLN